MLQKNCYSNLGTPNRIWAVSSIQGDVNRLKQIHQTIFEQFKIGDKIVYLGNYYGRTSDAKPIETINELLSFRRGILQPSMTSDDIVYLRGIQEEMWQKLLQVQFAPNPTEILKWMSHNNIDHTLNAYGSSLDDGLRAAREGISRLTRWTNSLRENIRHHVGHEKFGTVLKRAAQTYNEHGKNGVLFVHAGINEKRRLDKQGDSFWWSGHDFKNIKQPYENFDYIVRGFDPEQTGIKINGVSMSLDGGCGYGGDLICASLSSQGHVLDLLRA